MTEPQAAVRLDSEGRFAIPVPPAEVFPLFDPVREGEWAEGWRIEAVHPRPFRMEVDAVFEVPRAGEAAELWTVVVFEPAACRVEYVAVAGRDLIRRVSVQCDPDADGRGTMVTVRYRVTAWTPDGIARAAEYDRAFIEGWRAPVLAALVRSGEWQSGVAPPEPGAPAV